jgi:hypothetical protein
MVTAFYPMVLSRLMGTQPTKGGAFTTGCSIENGEILILAPLRLLKINDRQLVEQEISGPYKGSVEVMYSKGPHAE